MNGQRNCGECLMTDVEIIELRADGVCPRCGANYGPEQPTPTLAQRQLAYRQKEAKKTR